MDDLDQIGEAALGCDAADEALERASGAPCGGVPTLMFGSYCFTCRYEDRAEPAAVPSRA